MLDKLELHIPFKTEFLRENSASESVFYVPLEFLPVSVELVSNNVQRMPDGTFDVGSLRTKYESLPSSHSGMAMKIFNEGGPTFTPFVSIKCSPCKLLQGHNLYGFDCIETGASNMLYVLRLAHPELVEMLDFHQIEVSQMDITYSSLIPNYEDQLLFMDFLRSISYGQTKNRGDNYQTSMYFGSKNSRLKRLKAYLKAREMAEELKTHIKEKNQDKIDLFKRLLDSSFARQALRWEATICKRWLTRRGYPTNLWALIDETTQYNDFYQDSWQLAWADVFKSMQGQTVTKMNDKIVYQAIEDAHATYTKAGKKSLVKVNRLFSFFQTVKTLGLDHVKQLHSKAQYYKNVSDLEASGFSRATLQNLHKESGAQVIPMTRFIEVDFTSQLPNDYEMPQNLWEVA